MKTLDELTEMWANYVYEDKLDPSVKPLVAEGWKKCKAEGVNPNGGIGKRVDDNVFQSIRAANSTLIETALPIMQSVFEIVKRSHFLMVLTDSVGYILESIGDTTVMMKTQDMRFVPGALWSNFSVGTNAISVALDNDTAIQMAGAEHYCRTHHGWTCAAAPIHGANGEIVGCFNMSGDADCVHAHTLATVLAAAYGIEAQLSLRHQAELMRSALEGSADSIVLLGSDYHAIWMNTAATRLIGAGIDELSPLDFRTFMPDVTWHAQDWFKGERYFANDTRLVPAKGMARHCSVAIAPSNDFGAKTLSVTLKKQKHLIDSVNKLSGNRAIYSFDDIYTDDPEMKKTLALAQQYAQYDGNILIEGESGTGKELIAQAIHNSDSRAAGPFVAINCASIPRDTLEAELFGYEAGAFGGAAREGNPGRFELANRGTVFLDGITDMPLDFQSKLLRAVETHRITRVGGAQDIDLDIRIIASTNRRLDQEVSSGNLRRDLYYRLNVLKIDIPPLRSRPGDIALCAERFLDRLNTANPELSKTMSPEFLEGLSDYNWPGNVRELQNSVERAFYSTNEGILDAQSLSFAIDSPPGNEDSSTLRHSGEAGEILSALTLCGGDVDAAAKRLGTSRATLYRRIKKFGIDPKNVR